MITALTSGQLELPDWRLVLSREIVVSVILGGFLSVIGYATALFLAPSAWAAMVIPLTLLAVIIVGCMFGAALPLLFQRLGVDPAMMSNPFVAGIVDILGIVIYINIARLVL